MTNPLLVPELREMLAQQDTRSLAAMCSELQPATVAEFLSALEPEELRAALNLLEIPLRAEVFSHLDLEVQADLAKAELAEEAGPRAVAELLEEMAPDDGADLVQTLDAEQVAEVLPLVAREERHDLQHLATYPAETAGAVMTTDYVAVPAGLTVGEVIDRLREAAPDAETIYEVYVVDPEQRLAGVVSLRTLVLARPGRLIDELMIRDVVSAGVGEDQEEVANRFEQYDLLAMPVVDAQSKLVGIITVDDVVDVIGEEAEEDIYRLAAAGEPLDYWRASPLSIARQRVVWLVLLVFASLLAAAVMAHYSAVLTHIVALAFFIPLISGSSGNAGTQTSATVVRGLGTGEIKQRDLPRLVLKECVIGVLVGVTVAVMGAGRAYWTQRDIRFALIVGVALFVAVVGAKMAGSIFPVIFKRLGFDPALMSAPLISTIVDVGSIGVYLQLATWVLLKAA